jgi:hypothetical protein
MDSERVEVIPMVFVPDLVLGVDCPAVAPEVSTTRWMLALDVGVQPVALVANVGFGTMMISAAACDGPVQVKKAAPSAAARTSEYKRVWSFMGGSPVDQTESQAHSGLVYRRPCVPS